MQKHILVNSKYGKKEISCQNIANQQEHYMVK